MKKSFVIIIALIFSFLSINTAYAADSLYASFPGAGIWKWDGSAWTQTTPNTPEQMVTSGTTLYGSFTGGGIWKWDGTTWTQVTPNNPQSMVTLGTDLYGSFTGAGIWKWDGTTWTQVTPNNPQSMVMLGTDLYGAFTGQGIWKWNGSTWTQATPNTPDIMVATGTTLYGSFAGGGIWKWDGATWTQATPNNPQLLVAQGENLFGSFTGQGIWKWDGITWTQATPNNPQQMVSSATELYGAFTGGGIWKWDGATWTQVTPNTPVKMVVGVGDEGTILFGTLNGTAATGTPIVTATITVKDKDGTTKTVSTGTDGKYTLDVTGMKAPLLLKITASGPIYYSIATTTGTVNIHPYTDLIVRNWYKSHGSDVDTVFAAAGGFTLVPTTTEINNIEAVIRQLLKQMLMSVGIDSNQFNLISTAFNADNIGFDNVLERTNVSYNTTSGLVTVTMIDPLIYLPGGVILYAPITDDFSIIANPVDAAKTAINAMMTNLINTMNTKQCGLVAADIQPYLVIDYLDSGYDAAALATTMRDMLGCPDTPTTFTEWSIPTIVSYDDVNKTVGGTFKLTMANGGGNIGYLNFKKVGGSWLLNGDQEITEIQVASSVSHSVHTMSETYVDALSIRIHDYLNQTKSVTVNGPGVSNMSIPVTCSSATPTCDHNSYKRFDASVAMTPTVGSVYTITVTRTDNSTVAYTRTLLATPGVTRVDSDFSTFSGLTHYISGLPGHTVTAQVYLPLWITEISPPKVELSYGGTPSSVKASWNGTPVLGQYNSFSVAIPLGVTAAGFHLDAGAWGIPGWGKTSFWWYVE